jgi:hypothetical protein
MAIRAESLVAGGDLLDERPDSAALFAQSLRRLVQAAPLAEAVGSLDPAPAWVGWDHKARRLWTDPDDRPGDLNVHDGDRWLDEVRAAWAAGLWSRAFDARKENLTGQNPGVVLTRAEAEERARLAGL